MHEKTEKIIKLYIQVDNRNKTNKKNCQKLSFLIWTLSFLIWINITYDQNIIQLKRSQLAITCSKLTIQSTKTSCEICSKLAIKKLERRQRRSGAFIVNFKHISQIGLVFLSLTLSRQIPAGIG